MISSNVESSISAGVLQRNATDTDAALSLCALGRLTCSDLPPRVSHMSYSGTELAHGLNIQLPTLSSGNDAVATAVVTPTTRSPISQNMVQDVVTSTCPSLPSMPVTHVAAKQDEVPANAAATPRKYIMKAKDPKRDTSVPFTEMRRVMRVYGPIKALRNRASKDNGKPAKPDSIRRKFYRWFPDFNERFVKTPEGWYTPKAGHEVEMRYREAMRKMDQEMIVKKRNEKRYSFVALKNKRLVA